MLIKDLNLEVGVGQNEFPKSIKGQHSRGNSAGAGLAVAHGLIPGEPQVGDEGGEGCIVTSSDDASDDAAFEGPRSEMSPTKPVRKMLSTWSKGA